MRLAGRIQGRVIDQEIQLTKIDRRVWHQGRPRWACTSCADPAQTYGRYHRLGGRGVWYASTSARAAWAELLRHTEDPLPSPFEVKRKIGRVHVVSLRVLDLTNPDVSQSLGLRANDLTGDDVAACQDVSDLAAEAGAQGLLAPSAALPGHKTLVIYAPYLKAVTTVETSRVQRMPTTVADVMEDIRPVPSAQREVLDLFRKVAEGGRATLRRLRE